LLVTEYEFNPLGAAGTGTFVATGKGADCTLPLLFVAVTMQSYVNALGRLEKVACVPTIDAAGYEPHVAEYEDAYSAGDQSSVNAVDEIPDADRPVGTLGGGVKVVTGWGVDVITPSSFDAAIARSSVVAGGSPVKIPLGVEVETEKDPHVK
jgi:hypothetical protein